MTWVDWVTLILAAGALGYPIWRDFQVGIPTFRLAVLGTDDPDGLRLVVQTNEPGNQAWSVVGVSVIEPRELTVRREAVGAATDFPISPPRRAYLPNAGLVELVGVLPAHRHIPHLRVTLAVRLRSDSGVRWEGRASGILGGF